MAKFGRLSSKELKRALKEDEVGEFFAETWDWVKSNVENVVIGGVVVVVLAFLVPFYLNNQAARQAKAAQLITEADYLFRQAQAPNADSQATSQAQSRYQEIVTAYGSSPAGLQARVGLANCDYAMGKYDAASQEYSQFAQQHPKDPLAPLALAGKAYCLEGQGKFKEAADAFAAVAALYPLAANKGQCLLDAARNYGLAKDSAKAREALQKATQADLPDSVVRQARARLGS